MSDINFDIEVKGKKYNFSKLPADDMKGFMLGKFSNSCQSIGHDSERCVLDGMSKANAGFYIITDDKGNIRAQSYAWLAGEGKKNEKATSMVLDSFEHLGKEDKLLFVPIINKLREALQKQALNLYVGCGGQTPKLDINTIHPKPMEQDFIYGDATNVYPITREVPTIELNLGKNANNQVNQYSTIEELKTDSKLLQQIIISKQINRDLTEEEISLLNIGFTFAQISNIENDKQEFFVENDDNIKSLTDAGVSVKELLAMEPETLY